MKKYYGADFQGQVLVQEVATLPAWGATDERRLVYAADEEVYYVGTSTGWVPLVTRGTVIRNISQATHGFVAGDVIRHDGSGYTKAIATSMANSAAVGIVSDVVDANTFSMVLGGLVEGLAGLTAGSRYFLSPTTAGALTATEPTTYDQISKVCLIALSATSGVFVNERGWLVGDTNPVGTVILWPFSTPRDGYLELDGSGLAKATYADLYAAHLDGGAAGIYGDVGALFYLVDSRGMGIRAWDHGAGVDPDAATRTDRGDGVGGDVIGSRQSDAFQGHWHRVQHGLSTSGSKAVPNYDDMNNSDVNDTGGTATLNMAYSATTVTEDLVNTHGTPRIADETRMANINFMLCIKY